MPRRRELELSEIVSLFKQGLTDAVSRPTVHSYVPHEKQVIFHSATEKTRLYIGGNRSGKTVGGVVEDVYRMRGKHPYQQVPDCPTFGRIVTVSYTEGIEMIIKPELSKWLPPSDLINGSWEDSYNKSLRTLTLSNGSTCELMSYDQDLKKFAGTSRHWIHFDEEPPKPIYDECRMRLVDVAGVCYITMTPVEGMTWIYDGLYLPGLQPGGNIRVIIIDSAENPYINEEELNVALEGMDELEIKARKGGRFVQIGGLVYKKFNAANVIDELSVDQLRQIQGWTHYASMDHGLNNPTAWLWHAASPSGLVITYDEIYKNETLIDQFAREIHERNKLEGRKPPEIYVGDPAIVQRNAQTGDSVQITYSRAGIPIVLGNNNVPIGVEKMNRYLESQKWLISKSCPNLIRELQRVRWKTYENAKKKHDNNVREEIHKKDDHAPDSARYFFSLMPDMYIPPPGSSNIENIVNANQIVQNTISATTPAIGPNYFDRTLTSFLSRQSTEWSHIDEHMGGII